LELLAKKGEYKEEVGIAEKPSSPKVGFHESLWQARLRRNPNFVFPGNVLRKDVTRTDPKVQKA